MRTKVNKPSKKIMAYCLPADIYMMLEKEAEKKDRCNRSRALTRILCLYFKKEIAS